MPALLAVPPTLRSPKSIAWTRSDCLRLADAGLLPEKWELVAGEIISKMGQNLPHSAVVAAMFLWLAQVFGGRFVVPCTSIDIAPEDNPTSEPEPDITVLNAPARELGHNPEPRDMLLVVEVSDTTLRYDLSVKRDLFARAGIPEYWVFDVNGAKIHVFRDPSNDGYRDTAIYEGDRPLAPLSKPDCNTSAAALLS